MAAFKSKASQPGQIRNDAFPPISAIRVDQPGPNEHSLSAERKKPRQTRSASGVETYCAGVAASDGGWMANSATR